MKIQGKTFLVTGGASGLGEATCRRLITQGANVVIADLNADKGETLARDLGDQARFVVCDILSEHDVQTAIKVARQTFNGLHGSVHCAGIVVVQKLLDKQLKPADLDQFTQGVLVNLAGTFNVVRLVAADIAQHLTAQVGDPANDDTNGNLNDNPDNGVIINTASIAGFDGQVGQASYASSKAGVVGLTLPLARELARYGIRVMTIAPGIFATPMMASLPEKAQTALQNSVPYPKRLGDPAEFASLVCHIIENAYLNGETIRLDGAIRMV